MNHKDTSAEFLKDTLDTCRIILAAGVKGSSKSYTMLNFLKFCILTKVYQTFHLIMPNFKSDQNQEQYEFLKHIPKGVKVIIYTKYSSVVMSRIIDVQERDGTTALCVVDDATASGSDISRDINFVKTMTESRHLKLCLYVIVHCLKKVLSPTIRANIDYILLYKVTNDKLLRSFYEEYMSMMPDFINYQQFKHFYFERVLNVKYNGFFLDLQQNKYCANVKNWWMNTYDFDVHMTGKPRKIEIKEEPKKISSDEAQ